MSTSIVSDAEDNDDIGDGVATKWNSFQLGINLGFRDPYISRIWYGRVRHKPSKFDKRPCICPDAPVVIYAYLSILCACAHTHTRSGVCVLFQIQFPRRKISLFIEISWRIKETEMPLKEILWGFRSKKRRFYIVNQRHNRQLIKLTATFQLNLSLTFGMRERKKR